MRKNFGRGAMTGKFKRSGEEQGVEIKNVLADEVIQLGSGLRAPIIIKVDAGPVAQMLERTHVAYRCVQPDVKIFTRCIRDFEAEIGRVA